MIGSIGGIKFSIPDGMTQARYGMFIVPFHHGQTPVATLIGFYDTWDDARKAATHRFDEFRPGMALIQDTETGETQSAYNWNHDCLIWQAEVSR